MLSALFSIKVKPLQLATFITCSKSLDLFSFTVISTYFHKEVFRQLFLKRKYHEQHYGYKLLNSMTYYQTPDVIPRPCGLAIPTPNYQIAFKQNKRYRRLLVRLLCLLARSAHSLRLNQYREYLLMRKPQTMLLRS